MTREGAAYRSADYGAAGADDGAGGGGMGLRAFLANL